MSGKKVSCEDLKVRRGSGIDELIWHTTGSGKTLTSFKTAKLARGLAAVDMVLFVVDREKQEKQEKQGQPLKNRDSPLFPRERDYENGFRNRHLRRRQRPRRGAAGS